MAEKDGEKRVKLFLPLVDGKDVSQDVFAAVNFKTYKIRRGVEVEVPEGVRNVLEEAERARSEEIRLKQLHTVGTEDGK